MGAGASKIATPGRRAKIAARRGGSRRPGAQTERAPNRGTPAAAMNEHPSYLVYLHLGRFLASRGLAPARPEALETPRDRFITELEHVGHFALEARAPGGEVVVLFVLAPRGKYTDHGPQLRDLVRAQSSSDAARARRLDEVIVVAPEEVLQKKNMTDVVAAFQAAAAAGGPGARHYNLYPYHVFSLDIPRAQIVPPHELATPAEVRALLARERLALRDLPRIAAASPPVVWLGGRPGQVVRIRFPSETAGEAYKYCVVARV